MSLAFHVDVSSQCAGGAVWDVFDLVVYGNRNLHE